MRWRQHHTHRSSRSQRQKREEGTCSRRSLLLFHAQGGTRTRTPLKALVPETSESTNSTTCAASNGKRGITARAPQRQQLCSLTARFFNCASALHDDNGWRAPDDTRGPLRGHCIVASHRTSRTHRSCTTVSAWPEFLYCWRLLLASRLWHRLRPPPRAPVFPLHCRSLS